MKKHEKALVGMIVTAIIMWAVGFLIWQYVAQETAPKGSASVSQTANKAVYTNDGKQVEYSGEAEVTALDVLKHLTDVETKDSQFGAMVTGIHGVKAEEGKTYWAFYVNGTYANEGAGTYKTKNADKIMWKLEEIR